MAKNDREIEVTENLINIVSAFPGAAFNVATLASASAGTTGIRNGCVTYLYYATKGSDLDAVRITGSSSGLVTATNLNDFREIFEKAACCGHKVAFCVTQDNKIVMLAVYPCECPCDKNHKREG